VLADRYRAGRVERLAGVVVRRRRVAAWGRQHGSPARPRSRAATRWRAGLLGGGDDDGLAERPERRGDRGARPPSTRTWSATGPRTPSRPAVEQRRGRPRPSPRARRAAPPRGPAARPRGRGRRCVSWRSSTERWAASTTASADLELGGELDLAGVEALDLLLDAVDLGGTPRPPGRRGSRAGRSRGRPRTRRRRSSRAARTPRPPSAARARAARRDGGASACERGLVLAPGARPRGGGPRARRARRGRRRARPAARCPAASTRSACSRSSVGRAPRQRLLDVLEQVPALGVDEVGRAPQPLGASSARRTCAGPARRPAELGELGLQRRPRARGLSDATSASARRCRSSAVGVVVGPGGGEPVSSASSEATSRTCTSRSSACSAGSGRRPRPGAPADAAGGAARAGPTAACRCGRRPARACAGPARGGGGA
jgi:hypothetical protein